MDARIRILDDINKTVMSMARVKTTLLPAEIQSIVAAVNSLTQRNATHALFIVTTEIN